MLAAASTDPTDRSMPPVAITNVMPMAMMPVMLAWVSTLSRLSLVRKTPGRMIIPDDDQGDDHYRQHQLLDGHLA